MSEFRMPSLGTDMETGVLVEWLKQPGDTVARGDAVAVVETQKGAIEIECYESGVLDSLVAQIGDRVPVGGVLATIRGEHDEVAAPHSASTADTEPPVQPVPSQVSATVRTVSAGVPEQNSNGSATARISPIALRRMQEWHLDPASVKAGSDGIIGLREVEAAYAVRSPRKSGVDATEMRKAIAAAMVRSWREIPHYHLSSDIDMEPLLGWLEQDNAQRPLPERRHYAAPLIKAVALALKAVPVLNGHFLDGRFVPAPAIHLGIAIAMRGGGLIAPALHEADSLDLDEVMRRLNDLVARVRSGRLRSSEMTDATATLTNLGEHTADSVQGVIYPPQVAIVGCGQIRERPWAESGAVGARRIMTASVAGDHRVSDGRSAAKFLTRLAELLHAPDQL